MLVATGEIIFLSTLITSESDFYSRQLKFSLTSSDPLTANNLPLKYAPAFQICDTFRGDDRVVLGGRWAQRFRLETSALQPQIDAFDIP